MHDSLVMRLGVASDNALQRLLNLMSRGLFRWEYALDGIDCHYRATYNGKEFRLNCCGHKNQGLLIDGKKVNIGEAAINILCQGVAIQLGTQHLESELKDVEELNILLHGGLVQD